MCWTLSGIDPGTSVLFGDKRPRQAGAVAAAEQVIREDPEETSSDKDRVAGAYFSNA